MANTNKLKVVDNRKTASTSVKWTDVKSNTAFSGKMIFSGKNLEGIFYRDGDDAVIVISPVKQFGEHEYPSYWEEIENYQEVKLTVTVE
jgi:hypothetical protein